MLDGDFLPTLVTGGGGCRHVLGGDFLPILVVSGMA